MLTLVRSFFEGIGIGLGWIIGGAVALLFLTPVWAGLSAIFAWFGFLGTYAILSMIAWVLLVAGYESIDVMPAFIWVWGTLFVLAWVLCLWAFKVQCMDNPVHA